MSIPQKRVRRISKVLGASAASTLEGFLLNQLVPVVVDEFDVEPEDCPIEKFREAGVTIGWDNKNGEWYVVSNVLFEGVWTKA